MGNETLLQNLYGASVQYFVLLSRQISFSLTLGTLLASKLGISSLDVIE